MRASGPRLKKVSVPYRREPGQVSFSRPSALSQAIYDAPLLRPVGHKAAHPAEKASYSKDITRNIRPQIEQPNGLPAQPSSSTRSCFCGLASPQIDTQRKPRLARL